MTQLQRYGPKLANHPSVGADCPACHTLLMAGDYTALIMLGPGADKDARDRAASGQPYNAAAVEVHYACATGKAK